MANVYCEIEDIKGVMPDVPFDSSHDAAIQTAIEDASRAIDHFCGREAGAFFADADSIRYFDGNGDIDLWIGEFTSITTLQVAETGVLTDLTTWAATDYLLWPYNAAAEGRPYVRLIVDRRNGSKSYWPPYLRAVKITGKFGFSQIVPPEIRRATIIQAVRYYKRGAQAYSDVGAIIDLGQLRYVKKLDNDVATIVGKPPYKSRAGI